MIITPAFSRQVIAGRRFLLRRLAALLMIAILPMLADSAAVAADALDTARAAGHVGERSNGFIGLVNPAAPAEVKAMMDQINAERRARYQALASQNGTSPDAVGAVVFQKLVERLPAGSFYEGPGGWVRK